MKRVASGLPLALLAVLLYLAGCGGHDFSAPPALSGYPYAGTYSGSLSLGTDRTGALNFTIQSDGRASGSLLITAILARSASIGALPQQVSTVQFTVPLSGSA